MPPHLDPGPMPDAQSVVTPLPVKTGKKPWLQLALPAVVIVILGLGSGYVLATKSPSQGKNSPPIATKSGKEIGSTDEKTYRDCAQGTLEANDPANKKTEGSHHLIREGGPSQILYMISSVIALDDYIGKKVEVCGESLQSKKVPWFMDVGKLRQLE